jgi:FimV-like protein
MKSILYILVTSSLLFFSTAYSNPTSTRYGPVKGGETLWYIAYKHKPAGVTRWQMMRAIHIHNRRSFKNGNINLLQKGSVLILPRSKEEVAQFARGTASPAIATGAQTDLKKANAELKTLREELSQSRSALGALRKESKQLTKGERDEYKKNLDSLQQKIVALKQENSAIRQNKQGVNAGMDNALALKTAALEKAHNEVALLRKQNDLLKEQAATGDSRAENTQKRDRIVSETIAALNADIGQLRSRIKELEDLEKLKDAHIVELKKTLKHATRVIKDQDVLNRKMHAQLASMNTADPIGQQQAAFLAQKENKQAGVAPPLSDMVKSVSPKFWLLLTLGGLLLVLTFLWRSLSQRNLAYTEDEKGKVFKNDHRH